MDFSICGIPPAVSSPLLQLGQMDGFDMFADKALATTGLGRFAARQERNPLLSAALDGPTWAKQRQP